MTDDIDFDDLFALPEPKPTAIQTLSRMGRDMAEQATVKESVTVETAATYACPCGARCEVIQPAPRLIKCWDKDCGWTTMERYRSAYPVPVDNAIRV